MTVSRRRAFSLIEVVLALGIVSFALVAILGLMSVGLDSSRDSIDDTAVALLGQDAYNRVRTDVAKLYNQSSSSSSATTSFTQSYYYDRDGRYVSNPDATAIFYHAYASVAPLNSPPANLDPATSSPRFPDDYPLLGATVAVRWPVTTTSATPPATNAKSTFTFLLAKP